MAVHRPRRGASRTSGATADGGAVGAVDHDAQAGEVATLEHASQVLDVAPARVGLGATAAHAVADGPAATARVGQDAVRAPPRSALDGVGQLEAAGREELDAVVGERVVRGRDHRRRAAALGREQGDAGRGQDAEVDDVGALRSPSRPTARPAAAGPSAGCRARRGRCAPERPRGGAARAPGRARRSARRWRRRGCRRCRTAGPRTRLALGVLRGLAGLLQAVLLALLLAGVAGEQPGLLQGGAQLGVELDDRRGRCRGAWRRPGPTPRRRRWWRRCRSPRPGSSTRSGSVTTMRWVAEVK